MIITEKVPQKWGFSFAKVAKKVRMCYTVSTKKHTRDIMSNTFEYKCPCCGGSIVFDSMTQHMKCPYCETEFDPSEFAASDADLQTSAPSNGESADDFFTDSDGLRMYICESCGGEIVTDETTAATSCPFCGNAVVLKGNLSGILKPDVVVPFKLDKQAARNALSAFYKHKPLLPSKFITENKVDEIKGVYVPFWLYSADADAEITYKATKTRAWSDFRFNYVETSYYRVEREGQIAFENVPVDGSTKMPDDIMESIEPFDWEEAVDFRTAYLSGFFADKYDVTADDCAPRADERMTKSAQDEIKSTVNGYTTVSLERSNVDFSDRKVRYGLLPVWMVTTTWNNKKYTFAMNGQSGKFVGSLPISAGKAWGYFALIAAAVTAVCFGISMLLL